MQHHGETYNNMAVYFEPSENDPEDNPEYPDYSFQERYNRPPTVILKPVVPLMLCQIATLMCTIVHPLADGDWTS